MQDEAKGDRGKLIPCVSLIWLQISILVNIRRVTCKHNIKAFCSTAIFSLFHQQNFKESEETDVRLNSSQRWMLKEIDKLRLQLRKNKYEFILMFYSPSTVKLNMTKQSKKNKAKCFQDDVNGQPATTLEMINDSIKIGVQKKASKLKKGLAAKREDLDDVANHNGDLVIKVDERCNRNSVTSDSTEVKIQRKQGMKTLVTKTVDKAILDSKDLNNDTTICDSVCKVEKKNKKHKEKLSQADVNGFEEGDTVSNETSITRKTRKRKNELVDFQCEQDVTIKKEGEQLSGHVPGEDHHQVSNLDDASAKKKGKSKRAKSEDILLEEDQTYSGPTHEDYHQVSNLDDAFAKKKGKRKRAKSEDILLEEDQTYSGPTHEDYHQVSNLDDAFAKKKGKRKRAKSEDILLQEDQTYSGPTHEDYHQVSNLDDAFAKEKGKRKRAKSEDILFQENQTYSGSTHEDYYQGSFADSTSNTKKHKKREKNSEDFSLTEEVKIEQGCKTFSGPSCKDNKDTTYHADSTKEKSKRMKKISEGVSMMKEVFVKQDDGTSGSHAFKREDYGDNSVNDGSMKKKREKRKSKLTHPFSKEERPADHQSKVFDGIECEGTKEIQIKESKTEKGTTERVTDEASGRQEAAFADSSQEKKKNKRKHSKNDASIKEENNDCTEAASAEIPRKKRRKMHSENNQHKDKFDNANVGSSTPETKTKKKKKRRNTPEDPVEAANQGKRTNKDQLTDSELVGQGQSVNGLKRNTEAHKRRNGRTKSEDACTVKNNDVSAHSPTVDTNVTEPSQCNRGKTGHSRWDKSGANRKSNDGKRGIRRSKNEDLLAYTAQQENILTGDISQIAFKFKRHPVVKDYVPRKLLQLNGISPRLNVDEVNLKIPEINFNGSSINGIEGYGAD